MITQSQLEALDESLGSSIVDGGASGNDAPNGNNATPPGTATSAGSNTADLPTDPRSDN